MLMWHVYIELQSMLFLCKLKHIILEGFFTMEIAHDSTASHAGRKCIDPDKYQ